MGAAMADIALLLLVFFMATTSTEPPKGVEVTLPKALTQGAEQDSIYVSVSKSGVLYYDGHQVSLNELKDQLLMRKSEKNKVVAITADRNLDYRVIENLLDILKKSDFLNIVFMSVPREEEK
jgi:biopolymer transport protein ExbD